MRRVRYRTALGVLVMILLTGCREGKLKTNLTMEPADDVEFESEADEYLPELFARPDDFELVDKVFVRITESCDTSDPAAVRKLPPPHRVVLDVWGSGGLIGNGGFQYLFISDVDLSTLAESHDVIGSHRAAQAFREALSLFPNSTPHADYDERVAHLEKLGAKGAEDLDRHSRVVWAESRNTTHQLALYVRAHKEEYLGLPPTPWEDIEEVRQRDLPPPPPDADESAVYHWLESIDATVRGQDGTYFGSDQSRPTTDNPIASVQLSAHRNSIDRDLLQLSQYKALSALTELDLVETFVTAKGLDGLANMPNLRELSLAKTDVSDGELDRIAPLVKLTSLSLAGSKISDAGLSAVAKIRSLEELDLAATSVSDAGMKSLAPLENLGSLDLNETSLTGSGLAELRGSPLEVVRLTGSAVTDEGLSSLRQLTRLKEIDLIDTSVGDAALQHLSGSPNLERLSLDQTRISDAGLMHLAGLHNLKYLRLSGTAVSSNGLQHLRTLLKLEDLNLYETNCDDAGIAYLTDIRALKILSLSHTPVSDRCLADISQLSNLTSLNLSSTRIEGGPGFEHLEKLKNLERISLPKGLEGKPAVKRVQSQLPQAEFSFGNY